MKIPLKCNWNLDPLSLIFWYYISSLNVSLKENKMLHKLIYLWLNFCTMYFTCIMKMPVKCNWNIDLLPSMFWFSYFAIHLGDCYCYPKLTFFSLGLCHGLLLVAITTASRSMTNHAVTLGKHQHYKFSFYWSFHDVLLKKCVINLFLVSLHWHFCVAILMSKPQIIVLFVFLCSCLFWQLYWFLGT